MSRLRVRKRSRVGAQPGASSETTAPCCGEVVEQLLVRRRVGAVDTAGEHRDRGPARRPGRRGARPGRSRTRHRRPRPRRRRASAGRELGGRRRCRRSWPSASRRSRPGAASSSSRSGPAHPEAERDAAPLLQRLAARRGRRGAGPLGVARHHPPDAQPRRPGRGRARGRAVEPGRDVGEHAPRGLALGAACVVARRAAPSSATSAGQPQVAGLAELAEGQPGQSARRSRRAVIRSPSGRRARQSAARRSAAGARPRPRATPGRSTPRRSATVQASRWTRVAPRRVSRPARARSSSSAGRPGSAATPRAAPGRARAPLSRHGLAGVALGLPVRAARRPAPAPRRSTRARRSGSLASRVGVTAAQVPGDVDPVGDRAGDLAAVVAALHLPAGAPVEAGIGGGSCRTGTGWQASTTIAAGRVAPPTPRPGRS